MSKLQELVEWWDNMCSFDKQELLPNDIMDKARSLLAAEQSTPTEDEFEKWLDENRKESKRIADMADDENDIDQSFVSGTETRVYRDILEKYRTLRPKPTAINGHGVISCPHCFKPVLNDVKPTPRPRQCGVRGTRSNKAHTRYGF